MCLQSFTHALGDCFHRAMDLLAKDNQLDIVLGIAGNITHRPNPSFEDLKSTYQTLPYQKTCDNATRDREVFDAEVQELVDKLEQCKNPVIVLTFK